MFSNRFSQTTLSKWEDWCRMRCLQQPNKVWIREKRLSFLGLLFCFFLKKKTANLRGKEVPHIYTVIKEWVLDQKKREKPRPYFVWDSFVEAFPGYDPYLLERACEFLHDMGVLFLAKRSIGNKRVSLVCVDIQWLAKVARFCFSFG